MTEPQKPASPLAALDPQQIIQTVQKYAPMYRQYHGLLSLVGIKLPPELHKALMSLGGLPQGQGEQGLAENFQEQPELPEPEVAGTVMTHHLAEIAYQLHMEGMGTREIAEQFTKEGNPVSYTTISRWILGVEEERKANKLLKLIRIGRYSFFVAIWALSLALMHFLVH
jgi:hypothetical protein